VPAQSGQPHVFSPSIRKPSRIIRRPRQLVPDLRKGAASINRPIKREKCARIHGSSQQESTSRPGHQTIDRCQELQRRRNHHDRPVLKHLCSKQAWRSASLHGEHLLAFTEQPMHSIGSRTRLLSEARKRRWRQKGPLQCSLAAGLAPGEKPQRATS